MNFGLSVGLAGVLAVARALAESPGTNLATKSRPGARARARKGGAPETFRILGFVVAFGIVAGCLAAGGLIGAIVGLCLATAVAFPELAIAGVLTAPGYARLAWLATWCVVPGGPRAMLHGPALRAATLAATAQRPLLQSHERFLRARVSALRGPLRHPDALLAIANARSVLGETTWARAAMRALAALPDGFGDTRVQATNWLVADAASRGDWATVEALAPPVDALFARSKALRGAAAVRRGLPGSKQAASPPGGWWTQPVSLHRFVSGSNLPPLERPPQTGEVLPDALRLFAWVLRQAPARLTVVDFRLLAVAWGRVASGTEVAAGMGRRIATLDARLDPAEAQRRLLAAARDDLVPLLRAVPLRLRGALPPGTVVDDALDLLTRERVTTFEAAVRALVGPIPAAGRLESWAQYGAVLEAWDAVVLVASRELAAVTISAAWHALCNFAYSISAKEEEVLFAHHLYVWLEAACRSLDAAADVALLKRNILATA